MSSNTTDACENAESLELHNKAIGAELAKPKPRDSVLLPFMRSTYGERRMFVLNEATSVRDVARGWLRGLEPPLCHLRQKWKWAGIVATYIYRCLFELPVSKLSIIPP